MRALHLLGLVAIAAVIPSAATSLQVLSLDTMIAKSTQIVRGHATPASSFLRNGMIYTNYQLTLSSTLKGNPASSLEIAVPGGDLNGMHQTVAGSPSLKSDREYVFCVWKAPSGTNYLIGLSQGLFEVRTNSAGETILTRGPVSAELLDAASSAPSNNGITVTMKSLVSRIGQVSPQ